jgi:hypothetical protein
MNLLELAVDAAFAFYLPQFPFAPLWLLGLVLARRYGPRHPSLARVLTRGLGLCVINSLLITALWIYFKSQLEPGEELAAIPDIITVVLARIVTFAAWLLVLLAVFGWRTGRSTTAERLPELRSIAVGVLLGGGCGAVLLAGVGFYTPYYFPLFDFPPRLLYQGPNGLVALHNPSSHIVAAMIQFGLAWGAFSGGTAAATAGMVRAAILGAAAASAALIIGSTAAPDVQSFARFLTYGPVALVIGGLMGTGLRWFRQRMARK